MALSIKNEETERLARELARRTGASITEAITTALRQQLAREEGSAVRSEFATSSWRSGDVARRSPISTRALPKKSWDMMKSGSRADETTMVIDSSAALVILLGEPEE